MDTNELLAEAERLERPCLVLTTRRNTGASFGFWGGEPVLKPVSGSWRYWLTIRCDWLSEQGLPLQGILSVYTNEDDCVSGMVVHDPKGELPQRVEGGIRLYGREEAAFPPIEAFLKFGSPALKKCLQPDSSPISEWDFLENEYMKHCPLYDSTDTVAAVVGGWHHPWPDGDWEQLNERRLVLWTFRDCEPWVEVWLNRSGRFQVLQRIT